MASFFSSRDLLEIDHLAAQNDQNIWTFCVHTSKSSLSEQRN